MYHLTQFYPNTAAGRQKMDRKRKISLAISNGQADSKNYQMYSSGNKRSCLICPDRQKLTGKGLPVRRRAGDVFGVRRNAI